MNEIIKQIRQNLSKIEIDLMQEVVTGQPNTAQGRILET